MRLWVNTVAWLACVVYSTIPAFWFMIHPFAERWRARHLRSPYCVLLPAWVAMWIVVALITRPWRTISFYRADWTGVGSSGFAVCLRALSVFAIRKEFQREATRRAAGNSWPESRAAAGDRWNPVASAASGVPGASLRDAGMERRNRARGVLGADGVCRGHGSGDDPDGGCGVGEEVWRLLPRVSRVRTGGSAKSVLAAPAIIRSN